MKISFIIVNYRSAGVLKKCITSVFDNAKETNFEIVVVNNEKDKLTNFGLDANIFSQLEIVEIGENVGFGKACNAGTQKAKGDIFCFLNPDAEIMSHNLSDIVEEMERDQNVGIIGPKIIKKDGAVQSWSVGKEFRLIDLVMNHLGLSRSEKMWKCDRKICVDWVTGAALFSRRDVFEALEGFDEAFFLYFEDMDLCKRARFLGRRVLYFPDFSVVHHGGRSMKSEKQQKKAYYDSQDYYFEKHFGKKEGFFVRMLRKVFFGLTFVANKAKLLLQYKR